MYSKSLLSILLEILLQLKKNKHANVHISIKHKFVWEAFLSFFSI